MDIINLIQQRIREEKDAQAVNGLMQLMGLKPTDPQATQQGFKQMEQDAASPDKPFLLNAPPGLSSKVVSTLPVNQADAMQQQRANILDQIAGSEKGRDVLSHIALSSMTKQPKEFNTPGDLDTFLASQYPYRTEAERMAALNEFRKPEVAQKFIEWKRQVATPYFNVVPTSEGLVTFNARTGKAENNTGYGKPLSNEQSTFFQQAETLRDTLNSAKSLYRPGYVGPVAGRVAPIQEKTIGIDPRQSTFNAQVAQMKNTLVYMMSGKQINETEYQRLEKQLPDTNLPPKNFEARVKDFERTLESIIENKKKYSGGYGLPKSSQQPKAQNKSKFTIIKVE